jgi:hypothetical protein
MKLAQFVTGIVLTPAIIAGTELDQFNPVSLLPLIANSISQLSLSRYTTIYGALPPGTATKLPNNKRPRNSHKLLPPNPPAHDVQLPPPSDDGGCLSPLSSDELDSEISLNY